VIGVAAVAAVASYEHAYALVRAYGETGWIGRLVPLTVDGLVYASSMVVLGSARREVPVPVLARWLLGLGIAATLAANVAHGLGHGPVGAAVAAWPVIALVGSYELFMTIIRGDRRPDSGVPGADHVSEPYPRRIRCGYRLLRRSRLMWRPVAFLRSGLSARGRVWGSRVRSRYGRILPHPVTGRSGQLAFRVCSVSPALAGHTSPESGAPQGLAGADCPAEVIEVHQLSGRPPIPVQEGSGFVRVPRKKSRLTSRRRRTATATGKGQTRARGTAPTRRDSRAVRHGQPLKISRPPQPQPGRPRSRNIGASGEQTKPSIFPVLYSCRTDPRARELAARNQSPLVLGQLCETYQGRRPRHAFVYTEKGVNEVVSTGDYLFYPRFRQDEAKSR
jgi:hypothetical protein